MFSVLTLDVKLDALRLSSALCVRLMSAGGWSPDIAQGTWRSSQGAL